MKLSETDQSTFWIKWSTEPNGEKRKKRKSRRRRDTYSLHTTSLQGEPNALHMPVQTAARLPAMWD